MGKYIKAGLVIYILLAGCEVALAQTSQSSVVTLSEAEKVCLGKESGDTCSFVNKAGQKLSGYCVFGEDHSEKIRCLPVE